MTEMRNTIAALENLKSAVEVLSRRVSGGQASGEELWRRARRFGPGRVGIRGRRLVEGMGRRGLGKRLKLAGRHGSPLRMPGMKAVAPFRAPLPMQVRSAASSDAAALFLTAARRGISEGAGDASVGVGAIKVLAAADRGGRPFGAGADFWKKSTAGEPAAPDSLVHEPGQTKYAHAEPIETVSQLGTDLTVETERPVRPSADDEEPAAICQWLRQAAEIGEANRQKADDRIRAMREDVRSPYRR